MEHLVEYFTRSFTLTTFFTEVILAVGLSLVLLAGLFSKYANTSRYVWGVEILYLLVLFLSFVIEIYYAYRSDFYVFRVLMLAGAFLLPLFFPRPTVFVRNNFLAEYYFCILSSVLGFMVMLKADEWLTLVVALELSAVALYVLVISNWQKESLEGTLKYLFIGLIASVVMIYGVSWLYGLQAGNLRIGITELENTEYKLFYVSFFLIISSFLVKISSFPWHLWTPDAYQVAPTPVVAFLATVPKIGTSAVLYKICLSYAVLFPTIFRVFSVLAIISILWGNLVAVWQKNLKRMLAYSSVAHSGFFLVTTLVGKNTIEQDVLGFFFLAYLLANFIIFAIAEHYEVHHGFSEVAHFEGIGHKDTFLMIAMLAGFLTLAGLPPTVGFTAKLFLFSLIWQKYESFHEISLLVWFLVGLFSTFLALFYYLKIPFVAFLKSVKVFQKQKNLHLYVILSLTLLAVLILFFKPFLVF